MVKAAREAKTRTSWLNVNEAYEAALTEFVRGLLGRSTGNLFVEDLATQARTIAWFGALNSLSMTLIKLTSPGVPDIFQGNETLDLSLVDPDNRRPVDYDRRMGMLAELRELAARAGPDAGGTARALLDAACDGRAKLWVVMRALDLRRRVPELFARGDYVPVKIGGARERHAVAYARRHGDCGFLAVAGRMFASFGADAGAAPVGAEVWSDTWVETSALPAGAELTDCITGARLRAADGRLDLARVFGYFPGAILHYGTPDP
jgi:(1->4)-alpha-D-glucan 1-alpha-D-glucosylmutase